MMGCCSWPIVAWCQTRTCSSSRSIAVQTGLVARQVFGQRPRVAMLSFSTKGSARTPSTEKVAGAVGIARQLGARDLGAEVAIDGEMQADAALVSAIAERKMESSLVAGKANVLIFPDLNSGNIAASQAHPVSFRREVCGQDPPGPFPSAADLSRGASADDIVAVAAMVGLQAIEYRKLYPDDDTTPA